MPKLLGSCFLAVFLGALPLVGQGYQSQFSLVEYDRTKGPSSWHGVVDVEAATGAVNINMPLGPGIGGRGASFQPGIRGTIKTSTDIAKGGILQRLVVDHWMTYTEEPRSLPTSWGQVSFGPGYLELPLQRGIGSAVWTGPEGQSAVWHSSPPSGAAGTLLACVDPLTIASRFEGYESGWQVADTSFKTGGFKLGSDGELLIALVNSAMAPPKSGVPAQVDATGAPLNMAGDIAGPSFLALPPVLLVIKGDTAYEYKYLQTVYQRAFDHNLPRYPLGDLPSTLAVSISTYDALLQPNLKAFRDYPDMYYDANGRLNAWNAYKTQYQLTRILNRHQEWIQFTYPTDGGWVATWMVGGIPTGVSITQTATALTYAGVGAAYEFNLTPGLMGPLYQMNETLWIRDGQGNMAQVEGTSDMMPLPENVQRFSPGTVTNVSTGESAVFSYVAAPSPVTGDGTPWAFRPYMFPGTGMTWSPKVLTSVVLPGLSIDFEWKSYGYRRNQFASSTVFAGYSQAPDIGYTGGSEEWISIPNYSSFAGVTKVTETDLATGVQRVTTHHRVVPVPDWNTHAKWLSTEFYDAITRPDGSTVVHQFMEPLNAPFGTLPEYKTGSPADSTPDEQMQTLAHLKHQVVGIREYEPGADWHADLSSAPGTGSAFRTVVFDRWDLRSVANPAGDLTVTSKPYPTRTRTWSKEFPTMTEEESLDWDSQNLSWRLHRKSVRSVALAASDTRSLVGQGLSVPPRPGVIPNTLPAVRDEARTLSRNLTEWKFDRTDASTVTHSDATTGLAPGAVTSLDLPPKTTTWDPAVNFSRPSTHQVGSGVNLLTAQFTYEDTTGPAALHLHSATLTGTGVVPSPSRVGVAAYAYDGFGYLSAITPYLPTGRDWTLLQTNTGQGLPQNQTDANGVVTSFTWGAGGRLTGIRPPNGEIPTEFDFDTDNLGVTIRRDSRVTHLRYNGFGQLIREARQNADATWNHRLAGYDLMGRKVWETGWRLLEGVDNLWNAPASAVDPACTLYEYDGQGRLLKTTRPTGETVETRYALDGDGRKTQRVVASGFPTESQTIFRRDDLGRLIEVTDALGQVTSYTYDAADRIKQVTQADSVSGTMQTRTWEYDDLGRLTAVTQPESGRTEYSGFTFSGKPTVTKYAVANGSPVKTVVSGFDELDRLTSVAADDGTVNQVLTYDTGGSAALANGKRTAASDGLISQAFTYGGLNGRLDSLATSYPGLSQPLTQSFTYNTYGDRSGGSSGQTTWTLVPDSARPLPKQIMIGTQPVVTATYEDASWSLKQLDYQGGSYSSFSYDEDQTRLARMTHFPAAGAALADWYYKYTDHRGNLTTAIDAATGTQDGYSYDLLDRLTNTSVNVPGWGAMAQTYNYDAYGNMFSLTNTTAPAWIKSGFSLARTEPNLWRYNRLPENGSTGIHYDALGNMDQLFTELANPGTAVNMTYDALGRVATMLDARRGVTERYRYTAEGLRTQIEEWQGSTLTRRRYNLYNDARQLVSQFEEQLSGGTIGTGTLTALAAKAANGANSVNSAATNYGPAGASITSPSGSITVNVGQAVLFTGETDFGTKYTWTFGDNTSATGFRATHTFAASGTYDVTLTCTATNYSPSQVSVTITVVQPPPAIGSFATNATTIAIGGSATLSWSVSNATGITLAGSAVAASGSQSVTPTVTTTYTLSATNAGGTVSAQVTVNVVQPPVITSFNASPGSIYQGDASNLNWSVNGATSLNLDQGIGSVTGTSRAVSPSSTTTYTLTATNSLNGVSVTRTASCLLTVNPRPTVPAIASFTVDASSLGAGNGTTLRWNVTNSVGSVNVSISSIGSVAANSAAWVVPTGTTTYTLTATNSLDASKSVSANVTVTVVQKPVITFSAASGSVFAGSGTTLSWSVANGPTTVSIDQGLGNVSASGSVPVTPVATVTYTLSANNLGGTATATATVTVTQKPAILSLVLTPVSITRGRSSVLAWSVQGATSLTINGLAVTGSSVVVAPSSSQAYTLVATNGAGSTSANVTLNVQDVGTLVWKKDLLYMGSREVAEVDNQGVHMTLVDHLGSPRFLVNGSGVVESAQKFTPFGESLTDSISAGKFAKGFTNHEQTDPSGLIYMQARFYAPWYGRFLSPDPARDQHFEETQSWNIYSYVQNNPTMKIDPDGMQATSTGGAMTYYYLVQGGMSPEQAKKVVQDQNNGKAKGAIAGMTVNAGVGIMARVLTALGLNEARNPGSTASALKGVQQEAQAVSSEATTVIGHYPEYVAKASELGTRPFSVPSEVWNKMSSAEQWGANQKFLDRAIARGNSFSLATPLDKVKPGSFYAREIKYLMSKGYELSKDGLRLVKKATEGK